MAAEEEVAFSPDRTSQFFVEVEEDDPLVEHLLKPQTKVVMQLQNGTAGAGKNLAQISIFSSFFVLSSLPS